MTKIKSRVKGALRVCLQRGAINDHKYPHCGPPAPSLESWEDLGAGLETCHAFLVDTVCKVIAVEECGQTAGAATRNDDLAGLGQPPPLQHVRDACVEDVLPSPVQCGVLVRGGGRV